MGIKIFVPLPPAETREVVTFYYLGSEALMMKWLDSELAGHSLFKVDPFYFPLCHGGLA